MHTRVTSMFLNRSGTAAKLAALDATLAEFRASTAYRVAPVEDRERAERPMLAERREVAESFLRTQRGLVEGARVRWLAVTPAAVQRKAAIGNPARALEMAWLVGLVSSVEVQKIAAHLVEEGDAPGAYGLRLAIMAAPGDDGHAAASAAVLALKAGTSESDDALKVLLAAQREYSRSVGAVALDPVEKIAAAHEASRVIQEDGSSTDMTEGEIEALIGPPGA